MPLILRSAMVSAMTGRALNCSLIALSLSVVISPALCHAESGSDAAQLVRAAFDYYRDEASVARVEMTIHRPDWERTQVMHAWTMGEEDSLFTIIEPSRDRGNGTLKMGDEMWTFNPKVNRIIKLPPSMMSQSWMGSDFSNNDLAKADAIVRDYTHRVIGKETHDGQSVTVIESTPVAGAPVIWGKEILKIREDLVFLEEAFYDEAGELVKTLFFEDIGMISGKLYPRLMTMRPAGKPDQYTQIRYLDLAFPESLPGRIFTRGALRNPPVPDFR